MKIKILFFGLRPFSSSIILAKERIPEILDQLNNEITHAENKCFGCGNSGHFSSSCNVENIERSYIIEYLVCGISTLTSMYFLYNQFYSEDEDSYKRWSENEDSLEHSYKRWSEDEDNLLYNECKNGCDYSEIAIKHGRTLGAIVSRFKKIY